MKKLLKRLRYFKFQDLIAPFIFLIMILPSLIFRLINKIKNRHLWLICEDGKTARDNGYHFFKYVRNEHPNDYCFYVIDKNSKEYEKVKKYENIIQFKSIKHWLYYMSAEYNISIHKHGNPCQSFFFIIHVVLNLYNNRVFLQHGITKDDSPWIYYKNTKFRYFICGAKREFDFIKERFGYPNGNVIYTGFPRFDNLNDLTINEKQILIMPTWRNWMGGNYYTKEDFLKSDFYLKWNSLLNDEELLNYLKQNKLYVLFYPHQHVQKFIDCFKFDKECIKIAKTQEIDIQSALKESKILITDYSSVYMDFAYMLKPVIYFQFDYEKYRNNQLQQGYYDYKKDSFGPVTYSIKQTITETKKILDGNFDNKYINRMKKFFSIKDQKNCERIYEVLKKR